jgi:signal transduction histidine kinase
MGHEKLTYEDLEARLVQAERITKALRSEQLDAIVSEKGIYLVRLKELEEALKKSRDELEIRVRERTAELEKEIARRIRFEKALKESGEKLIRQSLRRKYLAQKLVELLEKDRHDVTMVLHDEVGSILTGARIEIELIETELAASPAADRITKVKDRITETINRLRTVSSRLHPDALERFGLVLAIGSMTEEVARQSGVKIYFHTTDVGRFSPEKELAIYRIVQESLSNIIKHAEAREVFISLSWRKEQLHLSVEDDGKGFDSHKLDADCSRPVHLGLSIMRERAAQFGGVLRIESKRGVGTQIMVDLPV